MPLTTRATLLARVIAGTEIGWEEFVTSYQPLIILRGGDRGLHRDELDDLVQAVLLSLFRGKTLLRYDPRKGRFRDYLKRIIDRRAFDLIRKRKPEARSLEVLEAEGAIFSSPDHDAAEARWEDAWQRHLLQEALLRVQDEVQPHTYTAFELVALKGMAAEDVAMQLELSIDSVYTAKHRVLARLRSQIRNLRNQL